MRGEGRLAALPPIPLLPDRYLVGYVFEWFSYTI